MDHDHAAQLLTAAIAMRVFGRDGVRIVRRIVSAGVRIGISDLVADAQRNGSVASEVAARGEQ